MSDFKPPKVLKHATSIHGDHLTIFEDEHIAVGVGFDDDGSGPYCYVAGCPNCGKDKGWWDVITHSAHLNSGHNPNDPCSRVCKYQLEWQAELAARKATACRI